MTIGENMRQLREENGYSLKQVEEKTGVNNGNLSRYERDLNFPSIEWCIKLADLYGVTIDELIGRSEAMQRSVASSPIGEKLTDNERTLLNWYRGLPSEKARASFLSFIGSSGEMFTAKRN